MWEAFVTELNSSHSQVGLRAVEDTENVWEKEVGEGTRAAWSVIRNCNKRADWHKLSQLLFHLLPLHPCWKQQTRGGKGKVAWCDPGLRSFWSHSNFDFVLNVDGVRLNAGLVVISIYFWTCFELSTWKCSARSAVINNSVVSARSLWRRQLTQVYIFCIPNTGRDTGLNDPLLRVCLCVLLAMYWVAKSTFC